MIEPKPPPARYEHAAPGDLLHIDLKKFARIVKAGHRITGNPRDEPRGAGWEFLYVAIDDHSRIAFTAMYPNEKGVSAADFLAKATAYFKRFAITVRRVINDNGPCFLSDLFRDTCRTLGIMPKRTRHYRASDQRQGRALHPDSHLRMGLRPQIRKLPGKTRRTLTLDPPIQLAPTAYQHRPQTTHHQIRSRCT